MPADGSSETRELAEQFNSFKYVVDDLKTFTRPKYEEQLKAQDTGFAWMKERLATISTQAKKTLDDIEKFIDKCGGKGTWQKLIAQLPSLVSRAASAASIYHNCRRNSGYDRRGCCKSYCRVSTRGFRSYLLR